MVWRYAPYPILFTTVAVVSTILARYAWRRRPPPPGLTPFVLLTLAVAEWSIGYALEEVLDR